MNWEKAFLNSYKEAHKYLDDIYKDKTREESISTDDYFEDGFIDGMGKVLVIMYNNHQKELEKENEKIQVMFETIK